MPVKKPEKKPAEKKKKRTPFYKLPGKYADKYADKAATRILNLIYKRVKRKKNKIPYDELSPKAKAAVKELMSNRLKRSKRVIFGAKGGLALGSLKIAIDLARKPSFKEVVSSIIGATVIVVTGAGLGFAVDARKIRKATKLVGKSLTQEALQNSKFNNLLNKYRYVYVDLEANVVLTNKPRLPLFGTIRLKSRDILSGRWQLL